jgi:hypothetical protein
MWHVSGQSIDADLLKPLKPVEVLYDFDGPRTFTHWDRDGQLCLAHWCDAESIGFWLFHSLERSCKNSRAEPFRLRKR